MLRRGLVNDGINPKMVYLQLKEFVPCPQTKVCLTVNAVNLGLVLKSFIRLCSPWGAVCYLCCLPPGLRGCCRLLYFLLPAVKNCPAGFLAPGDSGSINESHPTWLAPGAWTPGDWQAGAMGKANLVFSWRAAPVTHGWYRPLEAPHVSHTVPWKKASLLSNRDRSSSEGCNTRYDGEV